MVTIVNSKRLIDMLPPLDAEVKQAMDIANRKTRIEQSLDVWSLWLAVFAMLYILHGVYMQ